MNVYIRLATFLIVIKKKKMADSNKMAMRLSSVAIYVIFFFEC